jgi:sugar phosphate isomerase/epimerase
VQEDGRKCHFLEGVDLQLQNLREMMTLKDGTHVDRCNSFPSPLRSTLALNQDPGNAVMRGELDAFPNGWDALPKERIHHCHVKNAVKDDTGKIVWSPVDIGYI